MDWVSSGSKSGAKSNLFVDNAKIASVEIKYGVQESSVLYWSGQ